MIQHIAVIQYCSNNCIVVIFDGEVVSVNLDHGQPLESRDLDPDEFFFDVNNQSKAFADALKQGIVEKTGKQSQSGFCIFPVVRLTEKAKALMFRKQDKHESKG